MKRCMYCGHENDDAIDTCEKCGNHLIETPAQQDVRVEDVPDEPVPEQMPEGELPFMQQADPPADEIHIDEEGNPQPVYNGDMPQQGAFYGDDGSLYGENAGYPQDSQYGGQLYGYDRSGAPQFDPYRDEGYGDEGRSRGDRGLEGGSPLLMKKARKRLHNPLLFLGILFYTVHFVTSVLNIALGNAITNISTVSHTITKMTGQNVAVSFMNSIVDMINGVNRWYLMGAGFVACIPTMLLMIGLWMAFCSTTNKRKQISTAGFTVSRVAIVLKFIGVCAVLIACIVFSVAFVVSAGAASSMMSLIAGIIVLLIMILIAVFAILYYIQVLYSIKVIKANVKSGIDLGRIPGFAIFIGFVGCALSVLAMLPMAPDDYIGLVARGSYAAWLLLSSFWALIYRGTVKQKENGRDRG